jgi:hypothetical protein
MAQPANSKALAKVLSLAKPWTAPKVGLEVCRVFICVVLEVIQ